jgi:7-cyano-7-deazaguanine synthase
MGQNRPAILLLSGGLDSATLLALAAKQSYVIHALSIFYGQRHRHELHCAEQLIDRYRPHIGSYRTLELPMGEWGGSALTDRTIAVPKDAHQEGAIPVTYVPARNVVFLSLALSLAEIVGAYDLFIGVNALDYSGYPDCRPEFIDAFSRMANIALKATIEGKETMRIHTPLLRLTKAEIITLGTELLVDYSITSSCYDPSEQGEACGHCDACLLRLAGFAECGLKDPVRYQHQNHELKRG